MCTVSPEIVGPDLLIELETITAISEGSGPAGRGGLSPGPVVQSVGQAAVGGVVSKPLNAAGAVPPLRPFSFHHLAPQKLTSVPSAAFGRRSRIFRPR